MKNKIQTPWSRLYAIYLGKDEDEIAVFKTKEKALAYIQEDTTGNVRLAMYKVEGEIDLS